MGRRSLGTLGVAIFGMKASHASFQGLGTTEVS